MRQPRCGMADKSHEKRKKRFGNYLNFIKFLILLFIYYYYYFYFFICSRRRRKVVTHHINMATDWSPRHPKALRFIRRSVHNQNKYIINNHPGIRYTARSTIGQMRRKRPYSSMNCQLTPTNHLISLCSLHMAIIMTRCPLMRKVCWSVVCVILRQNWVVFGVSLQRSLKLEFRFFRMAQLEHWIVCYQNRDLPVSDVKHDQKHLWCANPVFTIVYSVCCANVQK